MSVGTERSVGMVHRGDSTPLLPTSTHTTLVVGPPRVALAHSLFFCLERKVCLGRQRPLHFSLTCHLLAALGVGFLGAEDLGFGGPLDLLSSSVLD